jgi:hypothetical protein
MSLTLNRETLAGLRPLFAKVFEAFTGGFAWTANALTNNTSGKTVPAGTLLVVNEANRTAAPVKRARLTAAVATGGGTATVDAGHMFEVGDILIGLNGTHGIAVAAVTDTTISIATTPTAQFSATTSAIGYVLVNVATTAATGPITTFVGTANSIALYPTTVAAGASVTGLRRGTAYANRIQPVVDTDDLPPTIQLSTSA